MCLLTDGEIGSDFAEHVARYWCAPGGDGVPRTEFLRWQAPDTRFYYVIYTAHPGVLFVHGDLGEAVYKWDEGVDLRWMSGCDPHYFAEKCRAHDGEGAQGRSWCARCTEVALLRWRNDRRDERGRFLPMSAWLWAEALDAAGTHSGWIAFLERQGRYLFGGGLDGMIDVGWSITIRVQMHLAGLKAAFRQIGHRGSVVRDTFTEQVAD